MSMMSLQDLMQAERELREFKAYATDERMLKMLRKKHRDVYDKVVAQAIELMRENHAEIYDDVMQLLYDEIARRNAARMEKNVADVQQDFTIAGEVTEYGEEVR